MAYTRSQCKVIINITLYSQSLCSDHVMCHWHVRACWKVCWTKLMKFYDFGLIYKKFMSWVCIASTWYFQRYICIFLVMPRLLTSEFRTKWTRNMKTPWKEFNKTKIYWKATDALSMAKKAKAHVKPMMGRRIKIAFVPCLCSRKWRGYKQQIEHLYIIVKEWRREK